MPHGLRRIEVWLDHLVSLGANGLLLGPVFTSTSHGYDTTDYLHIDPRLGDDDDLDQLVTACHDRGIRVLLDGVFNHAGREFPPVAQALAEGPGSPSADWVHRLYDNDGMVTADYFEGHDTLVTLNHASPRVQEFVREVMLHWLRRGIDGWRLDAAYAVPASFWGRCYRGSAGVPARRGRGGDDPRRLRRLRREVRDRLGDPVRAVARHLVRPGQGSTCTRWTGRWAGTAPCSST